MDTTLETNKEFDIIFIQKPPWLFICTIPSSSNKDRDRVVDTPNHSNQLTFSRPSYEDNNHSRVILYINMQLSHM